MNNEGEKEMAEWKEYVAKSVNEALTNALIDLETTSDNVECEVIEKEKSGFLGIGSKLAKIKVRVKEESKDILEEEKVEEIKAEKEVIKTSKEEKKVIEKSKEVEKAEEKETKKDETKETEKEETVKQEKETPVKVLTPEDADKLKNAAKIFMDKVFDAMHMQVEYKIEFDMDVNSLDIELMGDEMGILIGKRGQTLDSLQYLISLVVNKQSDNYIKVKLDTENYRQRRRETLENLAVNISHKVKRTKHSVILEPMNPYERRIIHSALQGDKFVETHSEGDEPYRKVVVTLKKEYRDYNSRGGRGRYSSYDKGYGNHRYNKNVKTSVSDKEENE